MGGFMPPAPPQVDPATSKATMPGPVQGGPLWRRQQQARLQRQPGRGRPMPGQGGPLGQVPPPKVPGSPLATLPPWLRGRLEQVPQEGQGGPLGQPAPGPAGGFMPPGSLAEVARGAGGFRPPSGPWGGRGPAMPPPGGQDEAALDPMAGVSWSRGGGFMGGQTPSQRGVPGMGQPKPGVGGMGRFDGNIYGRESGMGGWGG